MNLEALRDRHPATQHLAKWLVANPRLPAEAHAVAKAIEDVAWTVIDALSDGAELSAGLRKLREAKDCFVIQALEDRGNA